MSGFEVIGIVLGALPLFISAAEHYKSGYDAAFRFFRRGRVLEKYATELRSQHALLVLYLQALVGCTALPSKDQWTLVNNPSHPLWQSPTVNSELQRRLGPAKSPFFGNLAILAEALVRQVEKGFFAPEETGDAFHKLAKLKVRDEATSGKNELLWDRVKISLRDPEKNKDLQTVQSCNVNLERLIKAVEGAAAFRQVQDSSKAHQEYEVRLQAQSLFEALSCECQCAIPHELRIHTKPLIQCTDHEWHMWFDVLLSQPKCACCEMSVGLLKDTQPSPTASGFHIRIEGADPPEKGLNRLKNQNTWRLLKQICEAIDKAHNANSQLEIAIDTQQQLWEVNSKPHASPPAGDRDLLNLEQCLEQLTEHWRRRWYHREKAILCNILAHSMLQLHGSSWLTQQWSMKDVNFLAKREAMDPSIVDFKFTKPYFSSTTSAPIPGSFRREVRGHRNPSLLSLGVILLELYLNKSISQELAATSVRDIRPIVSDMLDDCYDNDDMSEEYRNAIRFCLWPDPDPESKRYSFEDAGFREKYYREVVMPLEDYLKTKVAHFDDEFWNSL